MGINTTRNKVMAFVVSAALAGVAGGLSGQLFANPLSPQNLNFVRSIEVIVMIVLGITVEYPAFDRVANVGCRRGGGSARQSLVYPNTSLSAISHSPSLRVLQSELAHSQQNKDCKF